MKKNVFMLLLLVLACAFVLAGCACEHEWVDADCLTAKTCAKCKEAEGDPLGHDWLDATCTAGETCSRCGETQGEPIEHSYGKWTVHDTEMKRACDFCGSEESAALDRETILHQELLGHWDFMSLQVGEDQIINVNDLGDEFLGQYLSCAEDGSAQFFNGQELYQATLVLDDYIDPTKAQTLLPMEVYAFHLENDAGENLCTMTYSVFNFTSSLGVTDPDALAGLMNIRFVNIPVVDENNVVNTFVLAQDHTVEPYLPGLWVSRSGNGYSLELRKDRTFTAKFDTEFSGTWHLQASYNKDNQMYFGLTLKYEKNGQTVIHTDRILLGVPGTEWMTALDPKNDPALTLMKGLVTLHRAEESDAG